MTVAVLVSMVAFLDSTVINLALPAIERDIGGGLALQQWIVDGYLLTMAAAILPGGSISDVFGRVPVIRFGLLAFGAGSVMAAAAGSPAMLIAARLIQGLGAAFLVPGSLALIDTVFDKARQSEAIGVWTGWTGTAFALGPLLGGMAVDFLGWRWIFVFSAVPVAIGYALTFWLCPTLGRVPGARVDIVGMGLSTLGLAATVYALIESQHYGWAAPRVVTPSVIGIAALAGFVNGQRHSASPMLPLPLFAFRNFAAANLCTACVYGALVLGSLAIALYTQEIGAYSATATGVATLPIPALSFVFARQVALGCRAGGSAGVSGWRPEFGGHRPFADSSESCRISRTHRPASGDDRVGGRACRDHYAADLGSAGLGAGRIRRPGVGDQQRRLTTGRADVDRNDEPDRCGYGERRRFRPRVGGERRTVRSRRVVCCAVDNQSACRVPPGALRRRGAVPRPPRCATGPDRRPHPLMPSGSPG
ncbi:MFS transporter [Mycolicibacter kumamotonensis]|uniref:MFS transporter n=1 Tax=Mycolicibacter kumamotonensis TaxID=354243 RepID=UPI001F27FD99|nr:MFS transporter [Mycolicibacter kumamotonensis]